MLKTYTLFLLILAIPAWGQSKFKNYVSSNISIINSIEPNATDYADLEVIRNAIGDARVVMLGEQDHGDAPTFLAKTRLIKYLREKKGFNVLAFESDFFALNEGWDQLVKQEDSIVSFLKRNIFSLWTHCKQCEDLFNNYIPGSFQSSSPLQISGFDSQNNGRYSSQYLKEYVDTYLKKKKVAFLNSPLYQPLFLQFLENPYRFDRKDDMKRFVVLEKVIDTILSQINEPGEFELLVLNNFKAFFKGVNTKTDNKITNQIRDIQMANNLEWLVNKKYADKKVIIWAANYHVMKNAVDAFKTDFDKRITMGGVFANNSNNEKQTYILGFTSRQGTAGRLYSQPYTIAPVGAKNFEAWVKEDLLYGFLDFKAFNKAYPHFASRFYLRGHWGDRLADWTNVFDGVFYIRDMYPCQEIK